MKKYYYCYNKKFNNWIFLEDEFLLINFLSSISNDIIIRNASLSLENSVFGTFVFFNKDFDILDVRDFEKKVNVFKKNRNNYYSYYYFQRKRKNNKIYGEISYTYYSEIPYAYRKDPVPKIHKYYYSKQKTKVKYKQIISTLKNPEKKEFIRKKHYQGFITNAYDYEFRLSRKANRNWKSKKIKHQWEKNKKKS